MISFKQFLYESLEGNTDIEISEPTEDQNVYTYTFNSPSGKRGEVYIHHPPKSKTAEIAFSLDDQYKGTGNESLPETMHVLNAVIKSVKHHSTRRNFDNVEYSIDPTVNFLQPKKAMIFDKIIRSFGKTPKRRKFTALF